MSQTRDSLYHHLGQLLYIFHQRTAELQVPLEPWRPLAASDQRLADLGSRYAPEPGSTDRFP